MKKSRLWIFALAMAAGNALPDTDDLNVTNFQINTSLVKPISDQDEDDDDQDKLISIEFDPHIVRLIKADEIEEHFRNKIWF